MAPGELQKVVLDLPDGVPFRREVQPTSYLYKMSVKTTGGFVPFLLEPCAKPVPVRAIAFLGAMIHVIRSTLTQISRPGVPPGGMPKGKDASGLLDTPLEAKIARKVTKAIHDFT